MRRRSFLRSSAGLGAFTALEFTGLAASGHAGEALAEPTKAPGHQSSGRVGRPVQVVSIGYKGHERSLESVVQLVDGEGSQGPDIIALAETWRGLNDTGSEETLDGPAVKALAAVAKRHRTYIVCPIDRREGNHRFNSCVLIDRQGCIASVYN